MALSKASLDPTLTKEETNFLRLAHLVIRISPTAVRILFDKHFNPVGLQNSLNQVKGKIESLCQKRVINQSQMDLLFPTTGHSVKSSDMDITLMLVLIRHFTKLKIKDKLPPEADVSEGDDLSRIKHYRNFVAHSADGQINDAEFQSAWKDTSEALQRIGGVSFKDECDALFIAELDNSYQNVYLHFVRTEKRLQEIEDDVMQLKLQQNDPVPSNIREQMLAEIAMWKTDEVKFFPTSAAKAIFSLVLNKSFVLITGSPGMGKSATAHHIALALEATEGFDILPVLYLKDIVKYCKNGCKQIFLIDDMCGKFTADKNCMREWERHKEKLQTLLGTNPNSLRVIGTCRFQISKDEIFQRLSQSSGVTECNLLSEDLKLCTDEKRKIASIHLNTEIVQKLDDETVNQFEMFPLLCTLFAKSDDKENFDIFHNPFRQLAREFDEIRHNNESCFVGLALLVINNNKLNKKLFVDRTNQELDQILDDLFEICRLNKKPVKHHVMAMLQALNKTYVTEHDSYFKAVHDKIFDIMAFYFGKIMIEIILEHGSSDFIERFKLESLNEPHDELAILIPPNIEDLYYRRLLQEIACANLLHALSYSQLKSEKCQRRFLTYLETNANISLVLIHNQWSYVLSELYGLNIILDYLINHLETETEASDEIELEECIDNSYYEDLDNYENSPMFIAITAGLYTSGQILLQHGVDSDSNYTVEDNELTLLQIACSLGRDKFVSMLLEYDCDVNLTCCGYAPLHIACEEQYPDIVDILLKANCDVDIQNRNGKTPLEIACERENLNIVAKLISSNCKVNISNDEGQAPLHIASCLGFEDVVKMLLSTCCNLDDCDVDKKLTHCDVNIQDNKGKTPLLIVCETGNINIVIDLLSSNCNVNLPNAEGQTPLHVACFLGCEDVVKLLLSTCCHMENRDADKILTTYCDVNIQDNDEKTPLFIACENGNKNIVIDILGSNCNVNLPNAEGQTPLHVSCIRGLEDIVQLLLSERCDIDACDKDGNTALAICCFCGHFSIAKLLIENCCDCNIVDSNGASPLEIALNAGHSDIVNLLLNTEKQRIIT